MQRFCIAAGLFVFVGVVTAQPVISALGPSSGPPGTLITISGKGFTPTAGFSGGGDYGGNTVRIGSGIAIKNLNSTDGTTVQFEIPRNATPRVYGVTVVNSNGSSNSVELTVTQLPPD